MTTFDLALAGLPECPEVPWMSAVRSTGWEGGGLVEPGPRDVALWFRSRERRFALVFDIDPKASTFKMVEGSAQELADWIEENRPELAVFEPSTGADTPCSHVWADLKRYANDPEEEAAWWQICDDCDEDRVKLVVDVGDA
jgi:hypothetical protein